MLRLRKLSTGLGLLVLLLLGVVAGCSEGTASSDIGFEPLDAPVAEFPATPQKGDPSPEEPLQTDQDATGSNLPCPDTSDDSCAPRDVAHFNLFEPRPVGMGYSLDISADSVEDVLEKGLRLSEASPVHIAVRGTTVSGSIRCDWRGVARTAAQREQSIRRWLDLAATETLPPAGDLERWFEIVLDSTSSFSEAIKANFRTLARGGLSTEYLFLTCYIDYTASEYVLGNGPTALTVSYDQMAEAPSYDLYRRSHLAGELGGAALVSESAYQTELEQAAWGIEAALSGIVSGRESVSFLAPMGAHHAIAVEAWRVVAQWDVQTVDGTVNAVRYGTYPGDPEHTQTLANLKSRITTAAASDASATSRIANVSGLEAYYRQIGAYGDITPDDGETTTFTPAQPPAALPCGNGTVVPDAGNNLGLVFDCRILLNLQDTLAGTATLNWNGATAFTSWEGVTTGGTPSRVTGLVLTNKSLTGTIPVELDDLISLAELKLADNQLTGCIPLVLRQLSDHDLDNLGLAYCGDPPPVPEGLSVSVSGATFTLNWTAVTAADQYEVQYRTGAEADWVSLPAVTAASTTFSPTGGLTCGTSYDFRIRAHGDGVTYIPDWGSESEPVTTAVTDTNSTCNHLPAFGAASYAFTLSDGTSTGGAVGSVSAIDSDTGDTLTYTITGGNEAGKFAINGSTGALTVAAALDYATVSAHTLTVEASDGNGGTATATVSIGLTLAACSNGVAVPGFNDKPGLVRDCSILLAARDTLAGTASLNWSADTAMSEWQGVFLDHRPPNRVYLLQLTGLRLTGSIPPSLSEMDALQRLDLDVNALTGGIPAQLGNMPKLEHLFLNDNQLTGGIPPELGKLSRLQSLYLYSNRLTGEIPSELAELSALTYLLLDRNQLTGTIPTWLGSMSGLQQFWARNNQFTGSVPAALAGLQFLYLEGNQLTGCIPTELRDIPDNDFSLLGLNFCDGSTPTPTPSPTPTPTP